MGVRWAVELIDGSTIHAEIKPAPNVTATQLAEEERLANDWLVAQSNRSLSSSDEDEPQSDTDHDNEDQGWYPASG